MQYFLRFNEDDNVVARQMFEEAVPLDPENPVAYTLLGWTHVMDVWYGSSESPGKSMERASELAQKALALDETRDYAHSLLGHICLMRRPLGGKPEGKVGLAFWLSSLPSEMVFLRKEVAFFRPAVP